MVDFPPVRYGVLGAANIARKFIAGVAGSVLATIEAVASRTEAKAAAFAAETGVARHHGTYEALLADPAIDAVYIPLPNDLHARWAIRAVEAGKHVLCEKPLATKAADARAMFDAARAHRVLLVEAYPYLSQPQTLRMRALLREGAIGPVVLATAAFGFRLVSAGGAPLANPADIRLDPERGGGGLLDAGCYAMSLLRVAVGERPTRAFAAGRFTPRDVDQTIAAILEFPSGAIGQLSSTMSAAQHRHAVIVGEAGVIETTYSNHAAGSGHLELRVKRGVPGTVPFETEQIDGGDGFRAEAESFARAIRTGAPAWNGASESESIDTLAALEAIAASARSGRWVDIAQGL